MSKTLLTIALSVIALVGAIIAIIAATKQKTVLRAVGIIFLILVVFILGFSLISKSQSVSIKKFGARTTLADNRNSFKAAITYAKNNPGVKIFIPSGLWRFKDSLLIDFPVEIYGSGNSSILHFPENKSCLVVKFAPGQNGFRARLRDFKIQSEQSPFPPYYTDKHGISSNTEIDVDNLEIYSLGGDGIHISACAIIPGGDNNNYGNASASVIRNVNINYCNNGIFTEGCDANTILIDNPRTDQNRRWGIYLNGMLGSFLNKPHCAFNGAGGLPGQSTVVTYNGKYYAATPGHDGYFGDAEDSNYNKQPDINHAYWKEVSVMTGSGDWNPNKRYYSGGAIAVVNPNSWSNIINPYTEAFQPPIWLNGRSNVIGGTNGAGVRGGSYDMVIFGDRKIFNSNLVLPNTNDGTLESRQQHLTVGRQETDYSAPLSVYNDMSLSGTVNTASFETTAPSGYLEFKNPNGTGYIGYYIKEFNFYPAGYGNLSFTVDAEGVLIHNAKTYTPGMKKGRVYRTEDGTLKIVN